MWVDDVKKLKDWPPKKMKGLASKKKSIHLWNIKIFTFGFTISFFNMLFMLKKGQIYLWIIIEVRMK